MNEKIRMFFEFRVPLIFYCLVFISIIVLYLFGIQYQPLYTTQSQLGVLLLFFGFLIRIVSTYTTKYMGKIKITGIYALCRHPILLGQFLSFVGLNAIVSNVYFTAVSVIIFTVNDCISSIRYDKLLSHHYRDIWTIYKSKTHFVLPFYTGKHNALSSNLSTRTVESNGNFTIFIAIYCVLVEIATLSNL